MATFDPERLRQARKAAGLSHEALARRIGISAPNLIAYEKGRRTPAEATLLVLARSLDLDPLALTDWTEGQLTLADLRLRAGLSIPALADRLGLSRSYWYRIERGLRPLPPPLASRLAGALKVPARQITKATGEGKGENVQHAGRVSRGLRR